MAIIDMKKLSLIALQEDREKILRLLQNLSMVELTDVRTSIAEQEEWEGLVSPESSGEELAEMDAKLGELEFAIAFLKRYDKSKKGFLTGKRVLDPEEYQKLTGEQETLFHWIEECRKLEEELSELRTEETRINNLIRQLIPWKGLDIPLEEIRSTKSTVLTLGMLPTGQAEPFRETLSRDYPESYYRVISQNKEETFVFLVYHKGIGEELEEALKAWGWSSINLSHMKGTPSSIIGIYQVELKDLEKKRSVVGEKATGLVPHKADLEVMYDEITLKRDRRAVAENFVRTEKTFILEGWIPAEQAAALEAHLSKTIDAYELTFRDPKDDEVFPTALINPPLVRPFEVVTDLYNVPSSRGIDPNIYMAPFFFVFFGIMLGDAGYGILVALIAAFFTWKFKPTGMAGKLGWLVSLGGISSLIWGALFGSWFGLELQPLLFSPGKEPIPMLALCFGLGALQIFAAIGLQAYMNIKRGKILDAIFDQFLWIALLIGLPLLAVPALSRVGQMVSIVSAVGLILTQGRSEKSIVKKLTSGILSLYGVTSYLSDVLSYSRLFALGLASGVIAMVINTMGAMLGSSWIGIPFMILILLGGHAFNIAINVLGAYVHSSRLQYIEFYGKFFEGGGKAFSPFRIKTKYVEVKNEEVV